ncbi:hypothetical protein GMOD_00009686 [Pyrenophora seminiperda CCB06]|uniref:DNA-(apurinic or apyrimidinic site) endonuclease 2 n=1 Tax=Pyrenophora seminiperda CCB06 TaxID=1302712 RepID=A0A3M7MEK2_9PLEO|nr:hypothetical protein GMOD_00009686 [Pyrenophora seminiperda CCB06]
MGDLRWADAPSFPPPLVPRRGNPVMVRITTWNVNGIRNPFGYKPWSTTRTFNAMFDILEADIVIMQELKIQRKDLTDDMVLVPGWDCYFSLPKHKKGYSGVAIYTRQSACAPIRAEEGVLGALCPPNCSTPYRDLPASASIGGYLTPSQVAQLPSDLDADSLDLEGRCLVLEFPAFVLFGVYSPANSNGQRDGFRLGFLTALETRIRNLTKMGKNVILTGDLNVSRDLIDTAKAEDNIRSEGMTHAEYLSTPNRRIFNQLLLNGNVPGQRDEGREEPVLYDLCREFHPDREGMFENGVRQREYDPAKDVPPLSGKLLEQFTKRRSIKDMFSKKPALPKSTVTPVTVTTQATLSAEIPEEATPNVAAMVDKDLELAIAASLVDTIPFTNSSPASARSPLKPAEKRRTSASGSPSKPVKRSKSNVPLAASKGQQSLKGFFQTRTKPVDPTFPKDPPASLPPTTADPPPIQPTTADMPPPASPLTTSSFDSDPRASQEASQEGWTKLFSKKPPPRCEHGEPCIIYRTKKKGLNFGREFWVCPRPIGPSGQKETGTQWRCSTFIWCSDWKGS